MGEWFGPYAVGDCLGAGGMATVHRATLALDDGTHREVALKRLLPHLEGNRDMVQQFMREGRLGARLKHPNIAEILELGRVAGTPYIAMELVQGDVLMVLMRRAKEHRQLPPIGVALAIGIALCDALDYAHYGVDEAGQALGVIHRDLTPSNLVITNEGQLKVIDFGVAKAMRGEFVTSSGHAKGKLGYMSFEAQSGQAIDGRADVFSMGVVLWELVTGRRLFKARTEWEVVEQIREGRVRPPSDLNPELPSELDEILLRAVARNYVDRWPSAAAMRVELEHVRRYYSDSATSRAVAAWKHQLLEGSAGPGPRIVSETDKTVVRLSTGDLEEVVEDWAYAPGELEVRPVEQIGLDPRAASTTPIRRAALATYDEHEHDEHDEHDAADTDPETPRAQLRPFKPPQ